jgi:hypothetical protein
MIINSYAFASGVGFTELYNFGDAMDYNTETNTIKTANTGFGYWGVSNTAISSSTEVTPQNGTYHGKIAPTSSGSNYRAEMRLQVIAGDLYTIKVWAQAGSGLNQIAYWAGWVVTPSPVTVTAGWNEYTFNVEASATGVAYCRFYPQFSSATTAHYMYIDNISIEKTN